MASPVPKASYRYRYHGRFISPQQAQRLGALPTTRSAVKSEAWEGHRRFTAVKGYAKPSALEVHKAIFKDQEARRRDLEARREIRDRARAEEAAAVERMAFPVEAGAPPAGAREWDNRIDLPSTAFEDRLYDDFFDDFLEVADVDDEDLYGG